MTLLIEGKAGNLHAQVNRNMPVRGYLGRRREVNGHSVLLVTNRPDPTTRAVEHADFSGAILERTGVRNVHTADTTVLNPKSVMRLSKPGKVLTDYAAVYVAGAPKIFLSQTDPNTKEGALTQEFFTWGMPTVEEALRRGMPYFGVCLGDQAMALAAGAKILPINREVQTVQPVFDLNVIERIAFLRGMQAQIDENAIHNDSVDSVPSGFVAVAQTASDPRSMLYDADRRAFGTQPHPELESDEALEAKIESGAYDRTGPFYEVTPGLTKLFTRFAREAVIFSEMSKSQFI